MTTVIPREMMQGLREQRNTNTNANTSKTTDSDLSSSSRIASGVIGNLRREVASERNKEVASNELKATKDKNNIQKIDERNIKPIKEEVAYGPQGNYVMYMISCGMRNEDGQQCLYIGKDLSKQDLIGIGNQVAQAMDIASRVASRLDEKLVSDVDFIITDNIVGTHTVMNGQPPKFKGKTLYAETLKAGNREGIKDYDSTTGYNIMLISSSMVNKETPLETPSLKTVATVAHELYHVNQKLGLDDSSKEIDATSKTIKFLEEMKKSKPQEYAEIPQEQYNKQIDELIKSEREYAKQFKR